jgi:hypothetical protein
MGRERIRVAAGNRQTIIGYWVMGDRGWVMEFGHG